MLALPQVSAALWYWASREAGERRGGLAFQGPRTHSVTWGGEALGRGQGQPWASAAHMSQGRDCGVTQEGAHPATGCVL